MNALKKKTWSYAKPYISIVAFFLMAYYGTVFLCDLSISDVPDIKEHAQTVWQSNGFEVVGYQGYEATQYGGCVWYTITRNNVTYDGCIQKRRDEYHIYNIKALDAISK